MKIKVLFQVVPKDIDLNEIVSINRYIDAYKKVSELKSGDEFLYKGAWYTVE